MLRDTAETFGWNPRLFLSQVISFAIVAFLLRRFAYQPILTMLAERRQRREKPDSGSSGGDICQML